MYDFRANSCSLPVSISCAAHQHGQAWRWCRFWGTSSAMKGQPWHLGYGARGAGWLSPSTHSMTSSGLTRSMLPQLHHQDRATVQDDASGAQARPGHNEPAGKPSLCPSCTCSFALLAVSIPFLASQARRSQAFPACSGFCDFLTSSPHSSTPPARSNTPNHISNPHCDQSVVHLVCFRCKASQ